MTAKAGGSSRLFSAPDAKQVVSEINARFEKLNKLWERAERSFSKYPVPEDVEYHYRTESYSPPNSVNLIDDFSVSWYLGYVKYGDSKRICVGAYHDGMPEEGIEWKPVLERSAETRIEAVEYLPQLKDKVIQSVRRSIEKMDKAIEQLDSFLKDF